MWAPGLDSGRAVSRDGSSLRWDHGNVTAARGSAATQVPFVMTDMTPREVRDAIKGELRLN